MKIFLAGAVSFAYESQIQKYEIFEKVLKKKFRKSEIITPKNICQFREAFKNEHKRTKEIVLNQKMVDFDLEHIKTSDLVVCDLSELSTGLGLELGVVLESKKNIIFFFEKGSYISNMIFGAFPNAKFVMYDNLTDLKTKLEETLN